MAYRDDAGGREALVGILMTYGGMRDEADAVRVAYDVRWADATRTAGDVGRALREAAIADEDPMALDEAVDRVHELASELPFPQVAALVDGMLGSDAVHEVMGEVARWHGGEDGVMNLAHEDESPYVGVNEVRAWLDECDYDGLREGAVGASDPHGYLRDGLCAHVEDGLWDSYFFDGWYDRWLDDVNAEVATRLSDRTRGMGLEALSGLCSMVTADHEGMRDAWEGMGAIALDVSDCLGGEVFCDLFLAEGDEAVNEHSGAWKALRDQRVGVDGETLTEDYAGNSVSWYAEAIGLGRNEPFEPREGNTPAARALQEAVAESEAGAPQVTLCARTTIDGYLGLLACQLTGGDVVWERRGPWPTVLLYDRDSGCGSSELDQSAVPRDRLVIPGGMVDLVALEPRRRDEGHGLVHAGPYYRGYSLTECYGPTDEMWRDAGLAPRDDHRTPAGTGARAHELGVIDQVKGDLSQPVGDGHGIEGRSDDAHER